ncbi:MAG: acetate--CoA ligase family protein, partial [Propionibacteriaceae bacterium]|nr:acetate--CoA ligase family protein [Propionibacteriaceae bacterium]
IAELAASRAILRLGRVPRIGVIGGSGGGSVLLSDAAHRAGVELAQLRPASVSALEDILPVFASAVNPLDVTAGVLERPEVLGRAAEIVAEDPEVELTVCVGLATSETTADGIAQGARQIAARGLPVIIARESGSLSAEVLAGGRSLGVPVVDGFDGTMVALARLTGCPKPVEISRAGRFPRLSDAIAYRPGPAGELESLGILAAAGVAVPRSWELTGDLDESGLPFPLVVKASGPEIFHKRQLGLISTGVPDIAALRREAARIRARVVELGIPETTVFAQETAPPGWEFFIGLTADEGFGPIVVVGLGGSLVERIDVTSTARAIAAYSAPERLVDELHLPSDLFSPGELSALATTVRAVAGLALDERVPLREADVNPVLLTASSTIAVDAKLVFATEGALVGRD